MNSKREFTFHHGKNGAAIAIRVTPRMTSNSIHEIMDDGTIKIRLTAPPVDGKANAALIEFLSKVLEIHSSKIEIVAGQTGRQKLVAIIGLDSEQVHERIIRQLSSPN